MLKHDEKGLKVDVFVSLINYIVTLVIEVYVRYISASHGLFNLLSL